MLNVGNGAYYRAVQAEHKAFREKNSVQPKSTFNIPMIIPVSSRSHSEQQLLADDRQAMHCHVCHPELQTSRPSSIPQSRGVSVATSKETSNKPKDRLSIHTKPAYIAETYAEGPTIQKEILSAPNSAHGLRSQTKRPWQVVDKRPDGPDPVAPNTNGVAEAVLRGPNRSGVGFAMTGPRTALGFPTEQKLSAPQRPISAAFRTVHTDPIWMSNTKETQRRDRDRELLEELRKRLLDIELAKWRLEPKAEIEAMLVVNDLAADPDTARFLAPLIINSDAVSTFRHNERKALCAFTKKLGDMCVSQLLQQSQEGVSTKEEISAQLGKLGFTEGQVRRLWAVL